ncbi:unnamed protein product [Notodromas monacha]|uniref:Uncharacterized protein n=1 Tax=Notodromas monacha TaxID=399045 RepID=A0A7R9BUS2_9CRUS|nr:unnamed protein product [Notodromas monacha]CAG0921747.1 unnamed protein product [Notodromas monacha]
MDGAQNHNGGKIRLGLQTTLGPAAQFNDGFCISNFAALSKFTRSQNAQMAMRLIGAAVTTKSSDNTVYLVGTVADSLSIVSDTDTRNIPSTAEAPEWLQVLRWENYQSVLTRSGNCEDSSGGGATTDSTTSTTKSSAATTGSTASITKSSDARTSSTAALTTSSVRSTQKTQVLSTTRSSGNSQSTTRTTPVTTQEDDGGINVVINKLAAIRRIWSILRNVFGVASNA